MNNNQLHELHHNSIIINWITNINDSEDPIIPPIKPPIIYNNPIYIWLVVINQLK